MQLAPPTRLVTMMAQPGGEDKGNDRADIIEESVDQ